LLLDYGCGIGRSAKELIARCGCHVIGVDISPSMRALAAVYVASDRFFACPPEMLDLLTARGIAFDAAISVWVLQHCFRPADDMARIGRALDGRGGLFVVNQRNRAVPTAERGWVDDGADIDALLRTTFCWRAGGPLDARYVTESLSKIASWGLFHLLETGTT
jgi:SAM-dependent methyltransferase